MEEINFLELLGISFTCITMFILFIATTNGDDRRVGIRSFFGVLLVIIVAIAFTHIGYQIGKDSAQEDKTLIENKQSIKDVNNE